jgi:hypothetical protein
MKTCNVSPSLAFTLANVSQLSCDNEAMSSTPDCSTDDRDLYDLRYFYVDQNRVGHYTCGVAFETMMLIFRTRAELFCDQEWYSAVRKSTNPVVRGFLTEDICLASIANDGLKAVDKELSKMSTATFHMIPHWHILVGSPHTHLLFVPAVYNFKAVDGVILLLNRSDNTAHMFPIQITLSKALGKRDSDEVFYTEMWWDWVRPLEDAGFRVQSTFVWIDQNQPTDQIEPAVTKELRSGTKVVRPEYRVVRVGIEHIDRRLASALGIAVIFR